MTNDMHKKQGVSLIAVLLFMMVATIAATATWKWITSEGKSSASRMLQREAYQSSVAGIENARAWMTYHANDVGALIKQFIDGGNSPIILDRNLRSFQRAGQNYHVWLTGVNTENSTYKLKILSQGEARNSTKHTEVAILNIDGLYQVKVPYEQQHSVVPFDYNYFGGSTSNHGDVFAKSMLINGNLEGGNPASIDSNLVVTGNFKVSGNSIAVHGTACIGGNLDADNGIVGNDFYVDGNISNLKIRPLTANKGSEHINLGNKIYGSVYANGDIEQANGNQVIDGNLTLNGKWTTNMSGYDAGVRGNLCVGENGQIYFPNLSRPFHGGGQVWMESDYPIWTGGNNYNHYERITLGSKGKDVYIKTGHPWSDYNTMRNNNMFYEHKRNDAGAHPLFCKAAVVQTQLCNSTSAVWWYGGTYKPYVKYLERPGLYYLYNWSSETPVVDFDQYTDEFWKWCRDIYCSTRDNHTVISVYKVNGERFWDNYNENTYKFLNYENGKITGSPYCKKNSTGFMASDQDKSRPSCEVAPWFKVDGTFKSPMPANQPTSLTCAEAVKSHCDSIWTKQTGCGGTKYLVPDALKTGISFFDGFANRSECVEAELNKDKNQFDFSNFSKCYKDALQAETNGTSSTSTEVLYNDYLVIRITSKNIFTSPKGELEGKFIFIFDNDLGEMIKLPPTEENSFAFLYFKDGLSGTIQPATDNGEFNYFVYTKNDISNVLFNQTVLKGSIYASVTDEATGVQSCAKVNEMTFNKGMEYNEALIASLTEARVICNNDGSACGGTGEVEETSSTSTETEAISVNGRDRYYISMAPQLGITVESQYTSNETTPTAAEVSSVEKSFIVLPRVIYLPSDPYGRLDDYYNVIPLNGSALSKDSLTSVTCAGGINTTGYLYSNTALSAGVHACEAKANKYTTVPFWVVVGSSQRGDAEVYFTVPSQEMSSSGTATVSVTVRPHATDFTLNVLCPDVPNNNWNYSQIDTHKLNKEGNKCTFLIPQNASETTYPLFNVTTTNATTGTLYFDLLVGEHYILSSPYQTDLHVSSTATINRIEATPEEISNFCSQTANADKCPTGTDFDSWPECSYTGKWVEPSGNFIPEYINESWSVLVGGTGYITLMDRSAGHCVVIIPDADDNKLDKSTIEANTDYELRATAKAKYHTLHVDFAGEIATDKNPKINILVNGRSSVCEYSHSATSHACAVSVFENESVELSVDSTDDNNDDFTAWSCSGNSCPTTDNVSSKIYTSFTVSDNATVVKAHFGEHDKHCFFEEFKHGTVQCGSSETEYCIDNCHNNENDAEVCLGVEDAKGTYASAKWHLLTGSLSNILVEAGHISIERSATKGLNNETPGIRAISTVYAGIYGTMKALFQLPQATDSYGNLSDNIVNSGFMLHSNSTGDSYLMLNLYENTDGHLEAQLCDESKHCIRGELTRDRNPVSVSPSSMVMMKATLLTDNRLRVTASTENYYGTPNEYEHIFALSTLPSSYADRAHEFVGFSMADPNFKLYGIGWKSEDYDSECFDSYPTVKCSFAAVAQNGIIPLNRLVTPWIGHSGWYDSKTCEPLYYYYNGNDAGCSGNTCSNGYTFDADGAGIHGYTDANDVEQKTAKAWLHCYGLNNAETRWAEEGATIDLAHCGKFWTGALTNCAEHVDLLPSGQTSISSEEEITLTYTPDNTYNLREATLNIELENPDGNEIEIWMFSQNDSWSNSTFSSPSVRVTGNTASFDVVNSFATGSEGFDPENVSQIVIKNHGNTTVVLKSLTSSCKHAVGVASCAAVYEETKWVITAQMTNLTDVTDAMIIAAHETNVINDTYSDYTTNSEASKITFDVADNPYIHQGESYKFNVSVTNGQKTYSTDCSVSPDPIGSISRTCLVNPTSVQTGKGMPQFQFTLTGCPTAGCAYDIYVDDSKVDALSGTTNGTVKVTPADFNTTADPLSVASHSIKVSAPSNSQTPFTDCFANFTVTAANAISDDVATTCSFENASIDQPGRDACVKANIYTTNLDLRNRSYKLISSIGEEVKTGSLGGGSEATICIKGVATAKSDQFTLYVNDFGIYKASCNASLTVGSPGLTCSTINEGGTDKFKIAVAHPCANDGCPWQLKKTHNSTVTVVDEGTNLSNSEYKIPYTGYGDYVLWINDEATDCAISLEEPDPAFTCPTNLQAIAGKENNVTITPSGVSGCDNGCSYTIAETSVTGSNYGGGALSPFTNSTAAIGDKISYEVSLTNNKTTVKHDCEVEFIAEPVIPVDNPGNVACYMDQYYDWGQGNMKLKFDNYNGAYSNKSYEVKDASNETRASGTSTGSNQTIEISLNGYASGSKLTLKVAGSEVCSVTPGVIKPYLKDCKLDNGKLHFQIEKCQNNQCSYQVKTASGTAVGTEQTGKGSGGYDVSVSDNGMYVIWLNGEETSCRIPKGVSMSAPVNCYFPQFYDWGINNMQLKIDNTGSIMNGKDYTVKNSEGTTVASGTGNNNGTIDINLNGDAYANGTPISVYVGSALYCSAIPATYGPVLKECKLDNYTISSGNSTTFRYSIDKCKNKQCPYQVKRGTTVVFDSDDDSNEPQEGGKTLSVSTAGTYVLWINGKETGCRATLNVQ